MIEEGRGKSSRQVEGGEFFLDVGNQLWSNTSFQVVGLELIALLGAGVTTDRADIDHAIPELNECSSHGWKALEVGDLSENELGQLLVLLFTDPLEKGIGRQLLAQAVGGEAVFRKGKVEQGGDG